MVVLEEGEVEGCGGGGGGDSLLVFGWDNTAGITHSAYSTDGDKGRVGELLRELPNLCVYEADITN